MSSRERPTAPAAAAGLPWPNLISAARLLLLLPFVMLYSRVPSGDAFSRRITLLLFFVMALSDALDGFLARRLNRQSRLGAILDPLADKLLITTSLILLSIPRTAVPEFRVPVWVPAVAIGKDVIALVGLILLRARTGRGLDGPRRLGKFCTVAQLVLVMVVLLAPDLPSPLERGLPAVWWAASGLAIAALLDYVGAGVRVQQNHLRARS